jgi:hypothetical protein
MVLHLAGTLRVKRALSRPPEKLEHQRLTYRELTLTQNGQGERE